MCVCVCGGGSGWSIQVWGRRQAATASFPQCRSWALIADAAGGATLPTHAPPDAAVTAMIPVSVPASPGHTCRTALTTSSTAAAMASRSGCPGTAGWGRPAGSGRGGPPPPAWPPGSPGTAAPMPGLMGASPGGLWKPQTAGVGRGRRHTARHINTRGCESIRWSPRGRTWG